MLQAFKELRFSLYNKYSLTGMYCMYLGNLKDVLIVTILKNFVGLYHILDI